MPEEHLMTIAKLSVPSVLLFGSTIAGSAQPAPTVAPPTKTATQDDRTTQGTIARLLPTPRGEIDGLLLDDGRLARFPPHMSTALLAVVGQGDVVIVEGARLQDGLGGEIRAWRIINRSTGQSVSDTIPPPSPRPVNWAGRDMRVSGRIVRVFTGPRGEANGVLLDNGAVVRFPPHAGEAFADILRSGSPLAAQGYGTSGPAGTAIEAVALGSSDGNLMSVGPRPR
jgi:hypothetical protein